MALGRWFTLALVAGALAWGGMARLLAGPEDVQPGAVRATFSRTGTSLKEEAKALARTSAALPYGTIVRVDQVQAPWVQVSVLEGAANGRTGWLRAAETIDPATLGSRDRVRVIAAGADRGVSTRDVSAAGRQLDEATEKGYIGEHPDLAAAYLRLDEVERANRAVDPAAVESFIRQGRLGRPGQ